MASNLYRFYVCIMWSVQNQRINWISSSIDNPFNHFFKILVQHSSSGGCLHINIRTLPGKSVKTKAMAALGVILVGNEGLNFLVFFLRGNSSHKMTSNICAARFMPRKQKKRVPFNDTLRSKICGPLPRA